MTITTSGTVVSRCRQRARRRLSCASPFREQYFAAGAERGRDRRSARVHEQTVARRLRAVEERTGGQVAARRAELEVALRLRCYLAEL